MRDQILVLDTLQRIDMELSQLEKNLREYPEKISDFEKEIETSKQNLESSNNKKSEVLINKSRLEQEIAHNEEMIKKAEQKLFEIKDPQRIRSIAKGNLRNEKKKLGPGREAIGRDGENRESRIPDFERRRGARKQGKRIRGTDSRLQRKDRGIEQSV